jgi:hypothetical protein
MTPHPDAAKAASDLPTRGRFGICGKVLTQERVRRPQLNP